MTNNARKWRMIRLHSSEERIRTQIDKIGADSYAFQMWSKGAGFAAQVSDMPCGAANILKQEAIAAGADAIVTRGSVNCSVDKTDAVSLGSEYNIRKLIIRLRRQPFGLIALGKQLEDMLAAKPLALQLRNDSLLLDKVFVMGILNLTPDSFSDGGKYLTKETALDRAKQIIDEGAAFIDIGAVSTRPGYELPSVNEEKDRLMPVMEAIAKLAGDNGVYVSLDSWRYEVLESCAAYIDMINDQSGLADARVAELAAMYSLAYCMMHNPADESEADVSQYMYSRALTCEDIGLKPSQIILDPGFGFGKDVEGNYRALRKLPELLALGYPILAGLSRKSMIGAAVEKELAERRTGTIAAETLAAINGTSIIRTHDVAACADAMKIVKMYTL